MVDDALTVGCTFKFKVAKRLFQDYISTGMPLIPVSNKFDLWRVEACLKKVAVIGAVYEIFYAVMFKISSNLLSPLLGITFSPGQNLFLNLLYQN